MDLKDIFIIDIYFDVNHFPSSKQNRSTNLQLVSKHYIKNTYQFWPKDQLEFRFSQFDIFREKAEYHLNSSDVSTKEIYQLKKFIKKLLSKN